MTDDDDDADILACHRLLYVPVPPPHRLDAPYQQTLHPTTEHHTANPYHHHCNLDLPWRARNWVWDVLLCRRV
jgi:hypothetical protein